MYNLLGFSLQNWCNKSNYFFKYITSHPSLHSPSTLSTPPPPPLYSLYILQLLLLLCIIFLLCQPLLLLCILFIPCQLLLLLCIPFLLCQLLLLICIPTILHTLSIHSMGQRPENSFARTIMPTSKWELIMLAIYNL